MRRKGREEVRGEVEREERSLLAAFSSTNDRFTSSSNIDLVIPPFLEAPPIGTRIVTFIWSLRCSYRNGENAERCFRRSESE